MRSIPRLLYLSALFLFISTTTYATNYYVDKNASGSNNGTSWANAWESFSAINWGFVNPGDIIYISGGTDSTVYYQNLNIRDDGSAGNFITIRNSYETGHNGRVIIDGQFSRTGLISTASSSGNTSSYIYIKGFEVRNGGSNEPAIQVYYGCSYITFDSLLVYNNLQRGFRLVASTWGQNLHHITIKNTAVITPLDQASQTDGIYMDQINDVWIDNCFVWARNYSMVNNHSDGLQSYRARGVRITNSVFVCDSNAQGMAMILGAESETATSDSVILYNNIIINRGIWWSGNPPDVATFNTRWYSNGYMPPTFVIHNTIISYGPDAEGIRIYYPIENFSNNILAQYGSGSNPGGDGYKYTLGSSYDQDVTAFSGENLYYREWSSSIGFQGGSNWNPSVNNWSGFVSGGAGGFIDDPDFTHNWFGIPAYEYTGMVGVNSPARNQGDNLQSLVESLGLQWTDRFGTPRDNTPTLGSFEYVDGGGGNNPPFPPSNPNPGHGSTNQPSSLTLTWSCSDPDGDPLTYDVYFGTNNNPPLVSADQSNTSFNPGQLNNNTTYYWKIVAEDNQGASTSGPVWNFTTESGSGGDNTPPELVAIQIVEPNEVVLDFSEPIDSTQISNTQNYNISNNITVLSVDLNETQQRLCLTTSDHDSNFVYSIEINGITDTAGNLIQLNSTFYKLLDIGQVSYLEYLMDNVTASATTDTNTSPQKTLDGLVNGDPDPNSRWAAEIMPQWIQYDLGAVKEISLIASSFYSWNMGRTYQYSIQISDDGNQWDEIVTNQTSSNQEWTLSEIQAMTYTRYVRIICLSSNQGNWAGIWDTRIFRPAQVPVELLSFTGEVNQENKIELYWSTASELNNQRFDIERRQTDDEYRLVGSIPGNGTTTEIIDYYFVDNSVEEGSYFYRLKQFDYNGEFSYSDEIDLNVEKTLEFYIAQNYPNPFNPSTTIRFSLPQATQIKLNLYNMLGELVETLAEGNYETGYHKVTFNASSLPSGAYIYRIESAEFVQVRKMVLIK